MADRIVDGKLIMQGGRVLQENYRAYNGKKKWIVNEGGTRSGKSYSIIKLLIALGLQYPNTTISICRKTLSSLKATTMKDFFDILKSLDYYDEGRHNKSDHTYLFPNNTLIDFFSLDGSFKIRGRKRDILFLDEANEVEYTIVSQLSVRTNNKIIIAYNPTETVGWVYNIPEKFRTLIHSTYLDNPWVSEGTKSELEMYKETDPELYEILALGKRVTPRETIYINWIEVDDKPEQLTDFIYGADFGYSNPSALIKIYYTQNEIYLEEQVYESHLNSVDLAKRYDEKEVDKNVEVIADHAQPGYIADLRNAGYTVISADKAVNDGIGQVKRYKIYYNKKKSPNIHREYQNYKWMKKDEQILDRPMKVNDHSMDAIRYGIMYLKNNGFGNSPVPPTFSFMW